MKKLVVEEEKCILCGACVQMDPEHFDFSEKGTSKAISNENLDSTALATAMDSCPVSIIHIVESDNVVNSEENKNEEQECDGACEGCHCDEKAA